FDLRLWAKVNDKNAHFSGQTDDKRGISPPGMGAEPLSCRGRRSAETPVPSTLLQRDTIALCAESRCVFAQSDPVLEGQTGHVDRRLAAGDEIGQHLAGARGHGPAE